MDSLSSGLFGVTARRVRVSRASDPDAVPLVVDQLTAGRPFSPRPGGAGLALRGHRNSLLPELRPVGARLAAGRRPVPGEPQGAGRRRRGGKARRRAVARHAGGAGEPDLSQASGVLRLNGTGLLVRGGTVTVPLFGTPTPVDLPRRARHARRRGDLRQGRGHRAAAAPQGGRRRGARQRHGEARPPGGVRGARAGVRCARRPSFSNGWGWSAPGSTSSRWTGSCPASATPASAATWVSRSSRPAAEV